MEKLVIGKWEEEEEEEVCNPRRGQLVGQQI